MRAVDVVVQFQSGRCRPQRLHAPLSASSAATDARIAWEHRRAEEEIRTALQPWGYYRPTIQASLERAGRGWRDR